MVCSRKNGGDTKEYGDNPSHIRVNPKKTALGGGVLKIRITLTPPPTLRLAPKYKKKKGKNERKQKQHLA